MQIIFPTHFAFSQFFPCLTQEYTYDAFNSETNRSEDCGKQMSVNDPQVTCLMGHVNFECRTQCQEGSSSNPSPAT